MLSVDEFIKKTVGVKWQDRACTFEAMDCWGLVILYYQHVLGLHLDDVIGYTSKKVTIESATKPELNKHWVKSDAVTNAIFVAYVGDNPVHVGIVIDDYALHAAGKNNRGQVQYNRISALEKFYRLEFYTHVNLSQRPERVNQ